MTLKNLREELHIGRILYVDFTQKNGKDLLGGEAKPPAWRKVLEIRSRDIVFETEKGKTNLQFPRSSELTRIDNGFRLEWKEGGRITYYFDKLPNTLEK
jgi:hypothetical protein